MAYSKAHRFNPSDYHYSLLCKALGHPARIAILRKIITHNPEPISPGLLYQDLPISRSSFTEHLKILRDMSIVRCEGMGRSVTYVLNNDLPNTYWGIVSLIFRKDSKYDDKFTEEIPVVGSRRTIGAVPL